jgi:hypothetical protein
MIHGDGLGPYRYFSLGFQERRLLSRYNGQTIIIRVAQHQHGSSTNDIEESRFYFQEFTIGVHGIGFLGAIL